MINGKVTALLTLLPIYVLDWFLTVFARLQLYILSAKGQILSHQRALLKKRKKKKSKKRRQSTCDGVASSSETAGGVVVGGGETTTTPATTTGVGVGNTFVPRPPSRLIADRRASEANAGLSVGLGSRLFDKKTSAVSNTTTTIPTTTPTTPTTISTLPTTIPTLPAIIPAIAGLPITPPPLDTLINDAPTESILFEANEQHRREFEGFLRSVKDIKDVHNWLKNFSRDASRKIAIVKLSRRILETDYGVEQAGSALAYMFKFGLYPIAVHGGFNELTRDTVSEVIARRREYSALLKQAIRRAGVGAGIISPDLCHIEPHIDRIASMSDFQVGGGYVSTTDANLKGGLSMRVKSVDHVPFTEYLERGKIPIWDGVAMTDDGVEMPLNGDVTTVELARLLQPFRIIFACNDGGILDKDHKAIPVVYMDKDYNDLMDADWVSQRRKIQLLQLKRIVEVIPSSCSVVVTSMENATLQLLYPRICSETVVKRAQDCVVHIIEDFSMVDLEQLRNLIEDSFGRPLAPNYFEFLKNDIYRIYLITGMSGEYNGCAVVTEGNTNGFYYLCKFCVRKSAQGLGLGDLLWRCLQRDIEKLYWRSRNNNPLNSWYSARCQGSFRTNEHFTVYWYGDDRFEDGLSLIDDAIKKPVTVLPLVSVPDA